ncbi:nucleotidyltransferase family protein [Brachybacterium subflavum]|uniref:nucleotidyltransferase family protein n=1 Tax=Brachybacterium subflavum TaxID=2585206 RepID=UPI00126625C6|nr:nucleotidyltransferase domain-containing protein [Brachybacterium subflavum]
MLAIDRTAVAELARRHHVHRLTLFGSGTTDDFDPQRSDADFLVEFIPGASSTLDDYFALKASLESLLGRSVDLVAPQSLENPYFADEVARTSVEIYAA